jgi:hypothetical protein
MAHAHSAQALHSTPPDHGRQNQDVLFKSDRPRTIDRYIDYFGGAAGTPTADADVCGDELLDSVD